MSVLHHEVIETHLEDARNFLNSQQAYFADLKKFDMYIDSLALTFFAIRGMCSLDPIEAMKCITDGGGDNGIDAIYLEESEDELIIHLFQTKYKKKYDSAFGKNDLTLFVDKFKQLQTAEPFEKPNGRLQAKWEEVLDACKGKRSFSYSTHFVTNGMKPPSDVTTPLKNLGKEHTVQFIAVEELTELSKGAKAKKHEVTVTTKSSNMLVESIGDIKATVCTLSVNQLVEIYENCGHEEVLQSNIRHYLGKRNTVNKKIRETALDKDGAEFFWFQNNGISIVCDKVTSVKNPNGYQTIAIENPLIVNGGQTTRTLYEVRKEERDENFPEMFVMVRLFETTSETLINKITQSTNSQSPITIRDLEANNPIQNLVKQALEAKGVFMESKRNEYDGKKINGKKINKSKIINNDTLFQYYISIFQGDPSEAKKKSKIFETYFDQVFVDTDKTLPDKFYKAFCLYEYIGAKEAKYRAKHKFLGYADLAVAFLLAKQVDILNSNVASINAALDVAYRNALSILGSIVKSEQKRLKVDYSHGNLFKGGEVVSLMKQELQKLADANDQAQKKSA